MSGLLSSPPTSPSYRRSRRGFARRCERFCCGMLTYFPLVIVYGLTSWAVWVQFQIGLVPERSFVGSLTAAIGVMFYILLNWSYTTAVFTDPGTPALSDIRSDELQLTPVTVKSTGEMRYCKKCQAKKPDRAHHCSTCRRCVLKMDHHCPWLATCVGLRNYKAFLLFLIYTSLFCWLCFFVSAAWFWQLFMVSSTLDDGALLPVHFIILSILSGIIGIVISGFTAWHLYLTSQNRTTIESLEKTRYLSPLRSHVSQRLNHTQTYADNENHSLGEQLRDLGNSLTEIHANALPGVLRPEEGEERMSPAQNSLRRNYEWGTHSNRREQDQYNEYLDERDNDKLPNAFHLGWKRNLISVMGPNPWFWALPICNSIGDGWAWEQNGDWLRERERLKQERQMEAQRRAESGSGAGWSVRQHNIPDLELGLSKADRVLGRTPSQYADGLSAPRPPPRSSSRPKLDEEDLFNSSDDESIDGHTRLLQAKRTSPTNHHSGAHATENWNDVPDDMVQDRGGSKRSW